MKPSAVADHEAAEALRALHARVQGRAWQADPCNGAFHVFVVAGLSVSRARLHGWMHRGWVAEQWSQAGTSGYAFTDAGRSICGAGSTEPMDYGDDET